MKLNGVGQMMSKEMNSIFKIMIKYDLVGGIILSGILYWFMDLEILTIFLLGLLISLINSLANGFILEYSLSNKKNVILLLSYFIRIILIITISIPFIKDQDKIIAYILGYTSHFGFLSIYWLKKWKEGI